MHKTLSDITLQLCLTALSFVVLASTALADDSCPEQFFDLTLPDASKQCRVFGVKKPAALSFYLNATADVTYKGFKSQLPKAHQSQSQDMLILVSEEQKIRVYVYPDGAGTQVNIRAE